MSYQSLEIEVVRWAEARQIVQNSNTQAQARKTLEEAGELLESAAALRALKRLEEQLTYLEDVTAFVTLKDEYTAAFKDAVGDVVVTLIVGCATADIDLTECLAGAYSEIKNRRGFLDAQGVFHKVVA